MNIVMPLAGRGSKFFSSGVTTPKPLISIRGKPMIKWATDPFPFFDDNKYIFLVLKDHVDSHKIDQELESLYSKCNVEIVVVDTITEGAACTVLLAKDLINSEEELIICNPDQHFYCDLEGAIDTARAENYAGVIPVFYATHPRWSYVSTDADGFVTEVAEKEQISTHATAGLYYFARGKDFVWGAEQMMEKDLRVNGEFYICPVYNELINRNSLDEPTRVITTKCDFMWGLGTPEEVAYFEKHYKGDL
jgi:dTDP-glucose pyrophosphorylase